MNANRKLLDIIISPFSSEPDKQQAQKLLDELEQVPFDLASPVPTASELRESRVSQSQVPQPTVGTSMWWVPAPSAEERERTNAMLATIRADVADAKKIVTAKTDVGARDAGAQGAAQDATTSKLLSVVNDPASTEEDVLGAKLALIDIEIAQVARKSGLSEN